MEESVDILISIKEYNKLKKDSLKLRALEMSGVDNWEGCGDAMENYQELLEEHGLKEED